jgi:diguanylate cyclase (GGDEF)-like protein
VITAINQAIPLDDNTKVTVTASIGISIYPSNSDTADSLLRFADEAMYVSKRSGRNCTSLYQDSADQNLLRA